MMANQKRHRGWVSETWVRGSTALALAKLMAFAVLATCSAQAQTFTVLHTFRGGGRKDGAHPVYGSLT